jgi:hypothetical protein
MVAIEWILFVWVSLNIVASAYYAAQGGFSYSKGERLFGIGVSITLGTILAFSGALTWVGWALIAIFVYNVVVSTIKVASNSGQWVSGTHCVFDALLSIVIVILILTVGLVV